MTICTKTPLRRLLRYRFKSFAHAGKPLEYERYLLILVCSLICNHDNQCEGNCVLGKKGSPVHFSDIENYISDAYFDKLDFGEIEKKNKLVGVIGGGPAGITIAILLARRGYDITLFESREKIGGVLRYGIPEFRLPKQLLERYKKLMLSIGIKIRPNTAIGTTITIDDLFRDGYKAMR